jgi:hypothetical protein
MKPVYDKFLKDPKHLQFFQSTVRRLWG